jgi:AcrR family transcriptional regulator
MATTLEPDGRRARSLRTRRRIVDAATRLFVERGYVATTVEAVAEAAGVAVQTVYYVFGTKQHLLAAALDAHIAGDLDATPIVDRPWIDELAAGPDAASAIEILVDSAVAILARAAPMYEVVRRAAADPEVGQLLTENRRARRTDQRQLVEILGATGQLPEGVDLDQSADVVYAILNEEVFQLLTVDCGWETARFRSWATGLLLQQLTAPPRAR